MSWTNKEEQLTCTSAPGVLYPAPWSARGRGCRRDAPMPAGWRRGSAGASTAPGRTGARRAGANGACPGAG
jgi:hypothetical protein